MVMAVTLTKFGAFTTSNVAVEEVIVAEGFMVVLSLCVWLGEKTWSCEPTYGYVGLV
jgi:hypothetical protein